MKKLRLLVALCLAVLLCLAFTACGGKLYYEDDQGLRYVLNSDGESYSVGSASTIFTIIPKTYTYTDLVIPETYNGLPVTSICEGAFYGCTSLTSVKIPDSVTSIGDNAFRGCTSLTSVTFKDTSTWYRTTDSSDSGGTVVDVTTPSTNAKYFTSSSYFWDYYWYKQ